MARTQRVVETVAQRAQLGLAAHLQRPVAVIVPLRMHHAALRLRLALQLAQRQFAECLVVGAYGGVMPLPLRLQLQRPAALQQGMLDVEIQFAQRPAPRRGERHVQCGEIGMQVPTVGFDAAIRRASQHAGERHLRPVERQLQLQLAEQCATGQLPVQPPESPTVGTKHVARLAVPHRAMHLLQVQSVQLRFDPRQRPACRQKPHQCQRKHHEQGQRNEGFSQIGQALDSRMSRAPA
ncbi:hypothetical protein RLIN73S_02061 [Rhodanobacter lindaniclasticus]